MGAVLEMTRRAALSMALAAALAGCGTADSEGGPASDLTLIRRATVIASSLESILPGGGGEENDETSTPPPTYRPEAVAAQPQNYRLIQINALGLVEPARVLQSNGDEVTLRLQSGPTAAFDGGILVATRGFGDDLYALESRGVLQALRAGGGSLSRRMETLDAQDRVQVQAFSCTLESAGTEAVNLGLREASLRRFEENCRSERVVFDNIYWLDDGGEIVASRQFVSPSVAYLRSNRL